MKAGKCQCWAVGNLPRFLQSPDPLPEIEHCCQWHADTAQPGRRCVRAYAPRARQWAPFARDYPQRPAHAPVQARPRSGARAGEGRQGAQDLCSSHARAPRQPAMFLPWGCPLHPNSPNAQSTCRKLRRARQYRDRLDTLHSTPASERGTPDPAHRHLQCSVCHKVRTSLQSARVPAASRCL